MGGFSSALVAALSCELWTPREVACLNHAIFSRQRWCKGTYDYSPPAAAAPSLLAPPCHAAPPGNILGLIGVTTGVAATFGNLSVEPESYAQILGEFQGIIVVVLG